MVEPESVGFTAQIARAAHLDLSEQIFFCQECGCVWRRLFDTQHFKFQDEVLGEYVQDRRASKLEPASWIVAASAV